MQPHQQTSPVNIEDVDFGFYLQSLRHMRGMKQSELAKRMGIAQQTLSKIERAPENIGIATTRRYFEALDLDLFIVAQDMLSGSWVKQYSVGAREMLPVEPDLISDMEHEIESDREREEQAVAEAAVNQAFATIYELASKSVEHVLIVLLEDVRRPTPDQMEPLRALLMEPLREQLVEEFRKSIFPTNRQLPLFLHPHSDDTGSSAKKQGSVSPPHVSS